MKKMKNFKIVIRDFIKKLLNIKIEKYIPEKDFDYRKNLYRTHFRINQIIDVGANKGQYAHSIFKYGFNGIVHSIEPLPELYNYLKLKESSNWRIYNYAIGAQQKTIKFFKYSNIVSSSILKNSNSPYSREVNSEIIESFEVQMTTLDSLFAESFSYQDRVWIKLDVQGYEWEAIIGAHKVLDNFTHVLEIELSFCQLYDGQKIYIDILNELHNRGWRIICINEECITKTSLETLQADFIFIKSY